MLHAASSYSLDIGVKLIANITTHKASMNLSMGLAKKEVVMSQNPIPFGGNIDVFSLIGGCCLAKPLLV